ncbi:basic amino acid ABC transporter substrate-binding protein [Geobacter sp. SVR]|uniref:basic amino acid ABC transporter substrate-binding protein n=1 Tax=Geobacter sp. SVR TaxID=2495594 RepID=UPI00143F02E2|nr:basic amino acid ABC transporter substrate-binding protein [Geobacter sp. SVR]BCS52845.1 basic amino acid ABC transporter substrate-binding protein [Geobacter sp. SVR]GCF86712.1 basic amino acid ABC transporter substrate-binding protein [Geobacter sp. SVR]
MRILRIAAAIAAMVATMTLPALAAPKTIKVATDATWPPMEMVDANKKIVGYDIDFMNAVAKEAGITVEFKNTAWDGIFAGVDAGQYDAIISSVTITDERKAKYDFTDAYTSIGQILVVPKTDKTSKTIADLKGKKIGAQIGTTGAMEVKKVAGVELKTYDEIGLAFEDMAAGRISGVVCDEPVAAHFALQKSEYKEKFKIVGKSFTKEAYGIVVKKGNKDLVALLNKGIAAVKKKKLDVQIHNKWVK